MNDSLLLKHCLTHRLSSPIFFSQEIPFDRIGQPWLMQSEQQMKEAEVSVASSSFFGNLNSIPADLCGSLEDENDNARDGGLKERDS